MTTIGFVYKITNTITDCVYVGSTTRINQRLSGHKTASQSVNAGRRYNTNICKHMREHGRDNFHIEILENVNFDNKSELFQRERHWIEQLNPVLNKTTPYVIPEETKQRVKKWHTDNKEHVKQYKAKLYQDNIVEMKAKQKINSDANKERNKQRAREWALAHDQVIECGCGSHYKECRKSKHIKTKRHLDYLAV